MVGRRRGVDLALLVEEGDEGDADARERSGPAMAANLTSDSDRYGRSEHGRAPHHLRPPRHAGRRPRASTPPSGTSTRRPRTTPRPGRPGWRWATASAGWCPAPSRRRSRRPRRWRRRWDGEVRPRRSAPRGRSGRGSDRATEPWRTATSAASCPTGGSRTPTSPRGWARRCPTPCAAASGAPVVVVTHGLILSIHLGDRLGADFDRESFWSRLAFPDAWALDADDTLHRSLPPPID